jgi:hypothetical protein
MMTDHKWRMNMMKLGKRTKVFPLPKMQIELFKQFVPQVQKQLGGLCDSVKIELKFVEHMAQVDGMRYNMAIEVVKPLCAMDMIALAQLLDKYCTNDAEHYKAADGRYYIIGDGDDTGAVMFENGEFNIWVRGWTEV